MADDNLNVGAEIARLRGDLMTGLARVEGQLNLLVQATDRTAKDVEELEARVTALEARRIPWPLVAAVSGAVSAVGAVVGVLVQ